MAYTAQKDGLCYSCFYQFYPDYPAIYSSTSFCPARSWWHNLVFC